MTNGQRPIRSGLPGRIRRASAGRFGRASLIALVILGIDSLGHLGTVLAAVLMAWLLTR